MAKSDKRVFYSTGDLARIRDMIAKDEADTTGNSIVYLRSTDKWIEERINNIAPFYVKWDQEKTRVYIEADAGGGSRRPSDVHLAYLRILLKYESDLLTSLVNDPTIKPTIYFQQD